MDSAIRKANVNANPDGLVITVSSSHVTLVALNMASARMEHVSARWAGMDDIALSVTIGFLCILYFHLSFPWFTFLALMR